MLSSLLTYKELKEEVQNGQAEFSQVVMNEMNRLEQVVKMENARIVAHLSKKEEHHSCPICLEEIPPILSSEAKVTKRPIMMPCC